MKKKRPQQQVTPPAKGLNILALKRSASIAEPTQEQQAPVSIEKLEIEAAPPPEPVAHKPVDELAPASSSVSTLLPESNAIASYPEPTPEPLPEPVASDLEQNPEPVTEPVASDPASAVLFQAVGIIFGEITTDGDKTFVTIGEKSYALYYASTHKYAYEALKKEITCTGITQQKLIVYPKITHFPGGKQPYRLAFQLAGFVGHSASGEGLESVLEENEFKICGLWQFIPVCRVPCISVFKNFDKQRLEYIKSAPLEKKVNFMKASHIPVLWRDAPVPPFRFNKNLDKETQGKASFVQIKARFNSANDNFEFISLLGIPCESAPNYLKAGKKDKAEAAKTKLAASKARKPSSKPVPVNNAALQNGGATSKPKPKPKLKVVADQ
ncbi:MAG: hypothetical protein KME25_21270 [Symplocastrum torsivum CPER-KK1]|jgi:hypothetical protein|uniref:Uncharacterized protein n=1 Tax=Symplocastrum torsivum CPER-KK1 TaxID=450513 RepID=A0A951PPD3_9CYAN|nr:hypothetical protein [Symplocastrum torsivum CPER-KK1]